MGENILVVLPHPDDETFGAGGTIILKHQAGAHITYICGTLGEMGRNMGKPFFATRESLPTIRQQELENACNVLGVDDVRLFGLRDKTVEFEDAEVIANRILAVIEEIQPDLIITHYPGYAVHPDHDAMARATVLAVSKLPENQRPPVHCMAITSNRFDVLGRPDVVVNVSEVANVKLAAISAHRSQSEGMLERVENEQDPAARRRMEQFLNQEMYWTYSFDTAHSSL